MINYKFEKPNLDDCEELAIVKQKAWATTYRGIYPDEKIDNFDYKLHQEKFKNHIKNPNSDFYKVVFENKIIGYFCIGDLRHSYKDFKISLQMLYLLEEYRYLKIGTTIMNLIKEKLKDKYDKFLVNCNMYNENAIKFYLKNGGIITMVDDKHDKKEERQLYIEFYTKV